tara:strand:+ start:500 stop:667 length:168 start_codon:yes stop_codon:yes gene_type:complete
MDYQTVNSFFQNIVSLVLENRLVVAIIWVILMYILLRKLAKKDNDYILKKFTRNK